MSAQAPSSDLIVVVDDEPQVRRSMERLLRAYGYRSASFADMPECLAATETQSAACVVADVMMPGGSGLELAQALRERPRPVPVVLISANDSEAMRHEASRVGVFAYLRKPVDGDALIDAIEGALQAR